MVLPGVFFTTSLALPRGRHQLDRDEVLTIQRERLMIAATELMATGGYRAVTVGALATRAQISRTAFYESFADKDDCIFAAYDRFIAVLTRKINDANENISPQDDWTVIVTTAIDTYLRTLQEDLVVARAFQVEMDSLGRPARQRRRTALIGLASLLKEQRDQAWPGAEEVSIDAYVAAVYAVRQLASDQLDEHHHPELIALGNRLTPALTELLRGSMSARLLDLQTAVRIGAPSGCTPPRKREPTGGNGTLVSRSGRRFPRD